MSRVPSSDSAEARRLAILASYPFDRTDIREQLDRLAGLAAKLCDAPIGLVGVIEHDRQRFIGRAGAELSETPREQAFCDVAAAPCDGLVVPDTHADARFRDHPMVTGEHGIRFYACQALNSSEGAPLGMLGVMATEPRQAMSEDQLQGLRAMADAVMALLERWRLDRTSRAQAAQSKSAIHDLEQRFQVLADAMPQLVWSTLPDGHSDYFNRGWCDYTGAPPEASFGSSWMDFLHPDDGPATRQHWQDAVASGDVYEIEYRLRRADGEYRWMLARGMPIRDETQAISRWIGTCTDIHEHKALNERQELLTRELSHRIKNIFAVISGLIALSLRKHPDFHELGDGLQQRVLALGRAHDFVRPHHGLAHSHISQGSLRGMLEGLLGAYQAQAGERISIVGDDVRIDDRSATPLALFFHELATNAAKYGALSANEGHVEIAIETADPGLVRLAWCERGGPPVTATEARGFGASLIDMSVTRQLGGALAYDWRKEGLRVEARIPAQMMAR